MSAVIPQLKSLFDLKHDQDDLESIDQSIRSGVRVGGTNLWILIFAILIASVGLNVNSTAVIIGAMLISPLMGPLIGFGYGAGIHDATLIRHAARSLAIFVVISLLTATLYFFLSPLPEAQSELLARTTPNFWDVLIALFGGSAGIIAQTRRNVSTVVPGVAIATALMPPLCTAGYGLAHANWAFFAGAFYLFMINAYFIALATFLFVKLMRMPALCAADSVYQRRVRMAVGVGFLLLVVPSLVLGYRLAQDQVFEAAAHRLLDRVEGRHAWVLLGRHVDAPSRTVELSVARDAAGLKTWLEGEFKEALPAETRLVVRDVGSDVLDTPAWQEKVRRGVSQELTALLEARNQRIAALSVELDRLKARQPLRAQLLDEILAQYPNVKQVVAADGDVKARGGKKNDPIMILALDARPALTPADLKRLKTWMEARHPGVSVQVAAMQETKPALQGR